MLSLCLTSSFTQTNLHSLSLSPGVSCSLSLSLSPQESHVLSLSLSLSLSHTHTQFSFLSFNTYIRKTKINTSLFSLNNPNIQTQIFQIHCGGGSYITSASHPTSSFFNLRLIVVFFSKPTIIKINFSFTIAIVGPQFPVVFMLFAFLSERRKKTFFFSSTFEVNRRNNRSVDVWLWLLQWYISLPVGRKDGYSRGSIIKLRCSFVYCNVYHLTSQK